MNVTRFVAAVLVCLDISSAALAQQPCDDEESYNSCFDRYLKAARSAQTKEEPQQAGIVEKNAKQEAAKAQTGADSGSTATASTLTDLLPLFDATGLISTSKENDGTLAFNLNFLLPVQKADKNSQLRLVTNPSPQPLTQLLDAFPETVRAARKDTLQKDISTFGDSRIEFTWSLVNSHFGRDFTVARPVLAPLYNGAIKRAANKLDLEALNKKSVGDKRLVREKHAKPLDGPTPFSEYSPADAEFRKDLMQIAAETGNAFGEIDQAIKRELVSSSIGDAEVLVEQQPQLLISLSHDIRDSIVGPEKTSATLTWEMTSVNLSAFLGGPGAACKNGNVADGGTEYIECTNALRKYLDENASASRWKLSASYQRVKAIDYRYPDDNVALSLPRTNRIEVTAGWGRPLQSVKNADRLDIEVAYDSNVNNDANNKERIKASLTYTRRVGDTDLPFSIIYANKDEFLGKVDRQISLHFGLKFKSSS